MAMYVEHQTMVEMRINFLKQMHEYVRFHINDENAYMTWILIVPDEPQEDDFEFIANDEDLWTSACSTFGKLVKRYEGR